MKTILNLTDSDFIEIAKLIDNNFIGSNKIEITKTRDSVRIFAYTQGIQCISCEIKIAINYRKNLIHSIFTQDKENNLFPYRKIYPETVLKIEKYLMENDFNLEFHPVFFREIDYSKIVDYVFKNCTAEKNNSTNEYLVELKFSETEKISINQHYHPDIAKNTIANILICNPYYKKLIIEKLK